MPCHAGPAYVIFAKRVVRKTSCNDTVTYFRDIMRKCFGKTEVYAKDNSDDQGSPINGQLSGLFFMTNNTDEEPPSFRNLVLGDSRCQLNFYSQLHQTSILQSFTVCVVVTATSHWSLHVPD